MTQLQLQQILDQAFPLIDKVSDFIKEQQEKITQDHIETKTSNSLVTYVDKTAEQMLVDGLGSLLPHASFVTEEDTVDNEETELVWIIDPLDGTTNFLCQVPFFSISVALRYQGEIVLGIVRAVMQEENFYALKDGGAFVDGRPLMVNRDRPVTEAILATGFPYDDANRTDAYIDILRSLLHQVRAVRRLGSAALDLAYVASGRLDGYYEKNLNIWDVAAGALLVREAGGKVAGFFDEAGWQDGSSIIAARSEVFDVISGTIKSQELG